MEPKFTYSYKFVATETSNNNLDFGNLGGLSGFVGDIGGIDAGALQKNNLDNELLLKEAVQSEEIISRFLVEEQFEQHIFPAKWNADNETWKERSNIDELKFFLKNFMTPIDKSYRELSHIPSQSDLAKKFFKDHFRYRFDSIQKTFQITCRFNSLNVSEDCATSLIKFLNSELRELHYQVENELNKAFREYLNNTVEIDIFSRDFIQNKIASSEVNLLTIKNDPNYILIILDKDANNYFSDSRNRLLIFILLVSILNIVYFLLPILRKFILEIVKEIKF